MNPPRLLLAFDDRLHPMVIKELRQALRSRFLPIAFGLTLVLELAMFLALVRLSDAAREDGAGAFRDAEKLALAASMICVPAYIGMHSFLESRDANADLTRLALIHPHWIASSRILLALGLTGLLSALVLPLLLFACWRSALPAAFLRTVLSFNALVTLVVTEMPMLLAQVTGTRPGRALLVIAGLLVPWVMINPVGPALAFLTSRSATADVVTFFASPELKISLLASVLFWVVPAYVCLIELMNPRQPRPRT